ncbi:hypothetical protein JCM8547_005910 [Rhodosporidiobolus lusitaniae]
MPRGQGVSERAKEIVREAYNNRANLSQGENLTKVIQERIKRETGEEYNKDQVNHVLRKLPNYQQRAGGTFSTPQYIYQNQEGVIIHPNEVFDNGAGFLVDANGYPVAMQEV